MTSTVETSPHFVLHEKVDDVDVEIFDQRKRGNRPDTCALRNPTGWFPCFIFKRGLYIYSSHSIITIVKAEFAPPNNRQNHKCCAFKIHEDMQHFHVVKVYFRDEKKCLQTVTNMAFKEYCEVVHMLKHI